MTDRQNEENTNAKEPIMSYAARPAVIHCPVWKTVSIEQRCPDGPKGHFDACNGCPFNK